ncbi:hypothetical protein [Streptomyces maremycinicus]|uniref:hypothetical protein n=1 Tax=Streptomyces maremycinicus TaxID=1679753 RepID=UPI000789572E|nr:hypothetical protein [Streptomyces sp. NBRC 110468]
MSTRTASTALAAALTAGLLLGACSSSDSTDGEAKADTPKPAETVTATATKLLSEEEISQQCTDAVADAAPGWNDWNLDFAGYKDNPQVPEVCKGLDTLAFSDAYVEGLDVAAACDTPAALPGRC